MDIPGASDSRNRISLLNPGLSDIGSSSTCVSSGQYLRSRPGWLGQGGDRRRWNYRTRGKEESVLRYSLKEGLAGTEVQAVNSPTDSGLAMEASPVRCVTGKSNLSFAQAGDNNAGLVNEPSRWRIRLARARVLNIAKGILAPDARPVAQQMVIKIAPGFTS
jgi:hypothetical protein